ncbi:Inositol oxygenase 2 [Olea europaea subsp. europaea]|uniref:Inositol oxygenase 2 n=1 Tax=Olea europaea subsp. europaea TaxID=158383 RepID=A0A8S0SS89_OLEEU|nr:Inositol oxygenase 2 [Olea europaea subsp. europaea]
MEVPKQPLVNEEEDEIEAESTFYGRKRNYAKTKKSSKSRKGKKGIDNGLLVTISGPLAKEPKGWVQKATSNAKDYNVALNQRYSYYQLSTSPPHPTQKKKKKKGIEKGGFTCSICGFSNNSKMTASIEMAKKLPCEKLVCLLNCLEASLAICGICSSMLRTEDTNLKMTSSSWEKYRQNVSCSPVLLSPGRYRVPTHLNLLPWIHRKMLL